MDRCAAMAVRGCSLALFYLKISPYAIHTPKPLVPTKCGNLAVKFAHSRDFCGIRGGICGADIDSVSDFCKNRSHTIFVSNLAFCLLESTAAIFGSVLEAISTKKIFFDGFCYVSMNCVQIRLQILQKPTDNEAGFQKSRIVSGRFLAPQLPFWDSDCR